MLYEYICEECKVSKEFEYSMQDALPRRQICPKCGKEIMHRNWDDKSVIIPSWMKSGQEEKMDYRD